MSSIQYVKYADESSGTCRVVYGSVGAVELMKCPNASTEYLNKPSVSRRIADEFDPVTTQLRIDKQMAYIASQRTALLRTKTILGPKSNRPHVPRWNQRSDRLYPSIQTPRTSRARLASSPGAMSPGGTGVDVKHGSYERYLAKKKNKNASNKTNECIVERCPTPQVTNSETFIPNQTPDSDDIVVASVEVSGGGESVGEAGVE